MDGFNVLNTVVGVPITEHTAAWWVMVAVLVFGLALAAAGLENESLGAFGTGIILIVFAAVTLANIDFTRPTGEVTPTRYEITLKPGAVIDAARYEIVEQRGEIYVIQERKHP